MFNSKPAAVILLAIGIGVISAACSSQKQNQAEEAKEAIMVALTVTSQAFEESAGIPAKYTCDGENISPPLAWQGAPQGTKSFAIISDDPDAPRGTWVHWVLYDLSATTNELPEAIAPTEKIAAGGTQGLSDFGKVGYGGPCPPGGTHRYYFKVYALDAMLNLEPGATKKELLQAMEGHVLAEGALMGTYAR